MVFSYQQLWHGMILSVYTVLVAVAAVASGWSLFMTLTAVLALPLLVIARERPTLPPALFGSTLFFTLSLLVVSVLAQAGGLWYDMTAAAVRPLGVAPEYALFAVVHTLYTLVLYEFLFDDGTVRPWRLNRVSSWGMLMAILLASLWYLYSEVVVTFAFFWLIALLLLAVFSVVALAHERFTVALAKKVILFAVVLFPVWLTVELLAVELGVRLYAFASEYVLLVPLGSVAVPLEEILLILIWPILTVLLYELFFDDAA